MQHRIYVGPFDAVEVLGVVVGHGQQIEVTAEESASLDKQPDNWARPTTNRAKAAVAAPAPTVATPPLQPPPVGEEDVQDDAVTPPSDTAAADPADPAPGDRQPVVSDPDTPSPAPGDGDDDTQEANQ